MSGTLSLRQQSLLIQLSHGQPLGRAAFSGSGPTSRRTIIRDLNRLGDLGYVTSDGASRATVYRITDRGRQAVVYDTDAYFRRPPGGRARLTRFEPELLPVFRDALGPELLARIERARGSYLSHRPDAQRPSSMARRELEHFTIELSWISSKFEGNTYTVFDTERLIREGVPAAGHPAAEARMILNHKRAIEYIWAQQQQYRRLTRQHVLEVHQLLSDGLDIPQGVRDIPVAITGTAYVPPAGKQELTAYLDDAVRTINEATTPPGKALASLGLLAYLQPFADGNKRTSRLIANAVLLAHDYPPLSFFTATEDRYKSAMLLVYEQGAVGNLAELMTEQLEYAGDHYFLEPPVRERQPRQLEGSDELELGH